MIDETQHDQAIAYVLGEFSPEAAASFEAELDRNFEMGELVRDLNESMGALALALPAEAPPPSLRRKILRSLPRKKKDGEREGAAILSWITPFFGALAACLAVALIVAGSDDLHLRARVRRADMQTAALRGQLSALDSQLADLHRENDGQRQQIAALENRNDLASVRIASLTPQTPPLAKADVIVVWDAEKQQGVIKLANLPKAEAGKDYQLWVIDPKYPTPVSAGVLSVTDDGTLILSFKPAQPIATPDKFAISVENAGGVPQPAGPIVFVGS